MSDESQLMDEVGNLELPSILKSETIAVSNSTVGGLLASARTERGWSIQQVSEQLKLSQSQILALESNQFQSLPTLVIVRGFVRAYAKLLKIDPSPLMALLPIENQQAQIVESLKMKPALSTPFVESKMNLLGRNDTNRGYIYGAVFLIGLVFLFLISQTTLVKNLMGPFLSSPQENVEIKNDAHKLSPELLEAAKIQTPIVVANEVQKTPDVVVAGDANVTPQVVASTPALVVAEKVQQATTDLNIAEKKENNLLRLKFRENSWVQVKSEKGNVLLEKLMQAGTEETIKVDQTIQVKIGNAAGVDGWLRGESLNIAPVGGSNVVNLSLK